MNRHRPLPGNISNRQIKQFEYRLVRRERSPVFNDLSQGHIQRLDRVGGVDHLSDLWRVEAKVRGAALLRRPSRPTGWTQIVP